MNLIVIGCGQMQLPVYRHARQMGLWTVGLDRDPDAPGRLEADHFLECDIGDEAACVQALSRLGKPYAGVVTVGTDFSTTVARVAEAFGLRSHAYTAAWRARDKALMRQSLAAAGIPVPAFQVVDPGQTPVGVRYPAVVKPVDNMGARGVRRVEAPADLEAALSEARAFSRSGRVIVEDFVEGPEFSLDALVTPEGFYRRGLADRDIHFPPYFVEMGHAFPSQAEPTVREDLWECLEAAARALGLSWGAVKGDLKWDGRRVVVGEVAARLSGGFMSGWTYPLASGREPVREAIELALGQPPRDPTDSVRQAVAEGAVIGIPGYLEGWHGLGRVSSLEGVRYVFLQRRGGESVRFPRNNVEKLANVIVEGPGLAEVERRLRDARRCLVPLLRPNHPDTEAWLSRPDQPAFRDGEDWYGVSWAQRLEDLESLSPGDWGALTPRQREQVREALSAGGIAGALYRWRCLLPLSDSVLGGYSASDDPSP